MVIYDLICDLGHEFEGWFKNSDEVTKQQIDGLLTCPYCDSKDIAKKLTASKVGKKSNVASHETQDPQTRLPSTLPSALPQSVAIDAAASPEAYTKLQKMLGEVHRFIDSNFEDVGNRFADEAISIHRGEKEPLNIRGTANQEQLSKLAQEGINALPIPPKPIDKKKLN